MTPGAHFLASWICATSLPLEWRERQMPATRLGTARAVALGAYAYAMNTLDLPHHFCE
jgi:ABC-type branched-subunit amino acid transport system permease subunit